MSDTTEALEAELRAKAEAATPGPRMWSGDAKHHTWRLSTWKRGAGRWVIMDFQRAGMQNAEPRFNVDGWMHGAREFPIFEVCREARTASDPRVYRHDIAGIRHPDAEFIAAMSPDVVLALLDRLEEARAQFAEANRKIEEALAELSDYTFAGLGNALAILSTDPNPTEGNTDV